MQHLFLVVVFLCCASATIVNVNSVATLKAAISGAKNGDVITLANGKYVIPDNKISCIVMGPVTVRAAALGNVTIEWGSSGGVIEGFYVSGRNWKFENLVMVGTCSKHSNCEHAWHIVGTADNTVISKNRAMDFNAQIKSNINAPNGGQWPDSCIVEGNEFYDTAVRNTGNPVTKVNIDGGRNWIVRGNYIHDFGKVSGVSYGTFMKSNSRSGIYERNLVVCKTSSGAPTDARIGISLGGGGTSPDSVCEDYTCSIEHQNGIIRNNIISSCNDVGIYLNEAINSKIYNNLLYSTTGIDNRFAVSTADIRNNIVGGGNIRNRDSATSTTGTNWITSVASLDAIFVAPLSRNFKLKSGAVTTSFVNQGVALPEVTGDYCKKTRASLHDIGAIDYSFTTCNTAKPVV